MGQLYEKGEYVGRDIEKAIAYYKRATECYEKTENQAYAPAQYALGVMYENGNGVLQNSAEAVKLYKQAADVGYPPAQNAYGWCFKVGKEVSSGGKAG